MRTIKCKITKIEKTFNHGHVVEAELIEGSIPNLITYADHVKSDGTIFQIPTYLIETTNKGICRLYFHTTPNNDEWLFNFEGTFFELYVSEYSNFIIPQHCKKMLLLIEESALFENLIIIDFLAINKIKTDVYIKTEAQGELLNYLQRRMNNNITLLPSLETRTVHSIFTNQEIGTRLYISGSWSMINHLKNIAFEIGLTDDEIQFKGFGVKKEKIMCVKCYSFNINETNDEIEEMNCAHCNTMLEVSSHYSRRLGAHLGYVKAEEVVIGMERRKK